MSVTKAGGDNVEGEIQSHQIAAVEHPPSYNEAIRAAGGIMNYHPSGVPSGAAGSHYYPPNLPPPGANIQMQPLPAAASAPYPQQQYPTAPHYGQQAPYYPNPYPAANPSSSPYNDIGFANVNAQQPQPAPGAMMTTMMPAPPNQSAEYNYPKTYVVMPDEQTRRRQSGGDAMDCCKCLLCCCGCIELCRCFGMCLKCVCDD